MVDAVKQDGKVWTKYMKRCEIERGILEQGISQGEEIGRAKERENTMHEKERADTEQKRADTEQKRADAERKRADAAEEKIALLESRLAEYGIAPV